MSTKIFQRLGVQLDGLRLSGFISVVTFPGFVAAGGFWALREMMIFSSDQLADNDVLFHIHTSAALFGYVVVPLFFVAILLWQGKISSLHMVEVKDRVWGFLGAVVGAVQVLVSANWDAMERANRFDKNLSKYLDRKTMEMVKNARSMDDSMLASMSAKSNLVEALQSYTWVVFCGLFVMYIAVLLGKKLSIHMCAATAVLLTFTLSFIKISTDSVRYVSPIWLNVSVFELGIFSALFLALIYWARRREKAHSHAELLGGMVVGSLVPIVFSLI